MQRRTLTSLVSTLLLATALPASVLAQTYPSKPIKFIVPYAAGGLPDTVARVVALRLTERLGQSVVVDNKPGGNGVVAYQALLQSSPQDGHAFIVSDGSMLSITPLLNKNATYKAGVDILPVSLIARSPLFIVAHPKTGVNNFQDFLNLVKSKPGNFTYGSSGIGSTHHLTMEALKAAMKIDVRHIPFKGSGQSTPALVGGQVDFSVAALPSMQGFAKNGQVSILASNAASRSTQAPDIPAIAETVPGFDFSVIIGVMAAAGTPANAIQKISQEIAEVVKHPELVKTFQAAVIDPVGSDPKTYAQAIMRENEAMVRAAKVADLKAE
jgi:tripartite-type tricarboxylate transporter receptor subunit TctC